MNIPLYCMRISFNHFSKNFSHKSQKSCFTSHFTVLLHKKNSSSSSSSSITEQKVVQFISSLNDEERKILMDAVKTLESDKKQLELKGPVTAFRWRSELGRPSKITKISGTDLSSADSSNIDESIPRPSRRQLIGIGMYNAVPFIGFGFLDNTFMILGGDTIELMLGSMITISTMAAAALGNTMADVLGIGSAYYVEKIATKLGFQQPQEVTPAQLTLNCSRVAANLGRTLGVTVGCILGMFPLLLK